MGGVYTPAAYRQEARICLNSQAGIVTIALLKISSASAGTLAFSRTNRHSRRLRCPGHYNDGELMPVTQFESNFEQIVLTQAAISSAQLVSKWIGDKKKDVAQSEQAEDNAQRFALVSVHDPDRGNSRAEVAENLFKTFTDSHATIFKYASQYDKQRESDSASGRVFQVAQLRMPENEMYLNNLKQIFVEFAERNYSEDGQLKPEIDSIEKAAKAMQELYETLKVANQQGAKHFVKLRYLRFPTSVVLTQLGSSEKWKDLNDGQGVNFNRGAKPKPGEDLEKRFIAAFSGKLDEENEREYRRTNNPSKYIHHYESYEVIGGHRFACLKFDDPKWNQRTHLLTTNGYTVDLTDRLRTQLEEQLLDGARLENLQIDFKPPQDMHEPGNQHAAQLMEGNRHAWPSEAAPALQRLQNRLKVMKESAEIDGHPLENGKATLACMDVDILTGLSMKESKTEPSETTQFGKFIKDHLKDIRGNVPKDLTSMSDFVALMPAPGEGSMDKAHLDAHLDKVFSKLAAIAQGEHDQNMLEIIQSAQPNVKAIAPRVMAAVEEHFAGKKTAVELGEKKRFFFTIGGVAAGKSNAARRAKEICGDHFVMAGLDDVRASFDAQMLNLVSDNHNFDYKNIEPVGKLVRAMVLERGREQGYHMLLDGSGIPYEGRFKPIVTAFKGLKYETNVLAFDRTLYVNDAEARRKSDQYDPSKQRHALSDALLSQGQRCGRDLRAVPIDIIAKNYASVPDALLQATADTNIDSCWLLDTNPKQAPDGSGRAKPYILSFTAEIGLDQLKKIDRLNGPALKAAIEQMAETDKGGKLDTALHHDGFTPNKISDAKWNFKVVAELPNDRYRIEVISDDQRYLSTLEKGLFNIEATGPEELFKLTRPMSFDVEGLFQNNDRTLKMQPEPITYEPWPEIPKATAHSMPAKGLVCKPSSITHGTRARERNASEKMAV